MITNPLRPFVPAIYAVGIVMLLVAIGDYSGQLWPFRPTDVGWRYGAVGIFSNFLVTPFVGWLERYPYEWTFSHEEVAYLLEVPLSHLQDPRNLIPDRRVINGREYEFQSYQFGDDLIWGATARMLGNFLDILHAL